MKKILGVVFASVALISGAFAKGIYSGDVQVNLGFNALSNELKVGSIKSTTSGGAFSADLQTWHLFALNDIISLGGRAGLNFDIGAFTKMTTDGNSVDLDDSNVTSLRFSIGPAVGFTFGDTVRLNVGAGLLCSFFDNQVDKDKNGASLGPSIGFDAEIQAKFLPKGTFSPLVGYRFGFTSANKSTALVEGKREGDTVTHDDSISFFTNTFYIGGALNF